jgi:methyl-accepting chemotaxis protein
MNRLSLKIAYPIIIAGLFVIVSYVALNYSDLNTSFYVISSFLVAYVFLFGFAIGQNYTKPVKKLLEKANDLSEGDLKTRFYIESKDEIGELSTAFNKIADKLEESTSENEKTKKSVGIRVEAETQSLKEIITALEQKVQNRTLENQKINKDLEAIREYSKQKETEINQFKEQLEQVKPKRAPKKAKAPKSAKADDSSQDAPTDSDQ